MGERRIDVEIQPADGGWLATVTVAEGDASTKHRVRIPAADLERLAPGATPEALVRASFAFLLEREAKESILREFEIGAIARYFPEYEREIRRQRLVND
jgi:hypothetical protein